MHNGDQEVAQARRTDHLDLASLHHKEWHVGLAALDQHFAVRDWTNHPMGGNPRDLPTVSFGNMSAAFRRS